MPIGIIIIAVLSIAAVIAAKCCGVEIDPVGRSKKYFNDLRDRWKWLDRNLNRFKRFKREPQLLDNKTTLFVENDAFDVEGFEPYYQPIRNVRYVRPSIQSISESLMTTESLMNTPIDSPITRPRGRPKTLCLSRVRYISATTVTPISTVDSEFTNFNFVDDQASAVASAQGRFSMSTVHSDGGGQTPMMHNHPAMFFKKGTDFNRIV